MWRRAMTDVGKRRERLQGAPTPVSWREMTGGEAGRFRDEMQGRGNGATTVLVVRGGTLV